MPTTARRSKRIWWSDSDYIGATGVNSPEEFAELALSDATFADAFEDAPEQSIEAVARHAVAIGLHVTVVPAAHLHREQWDAAMTFDHGQNWALAPGRGYVKVIGVAL